MAYHKFLHRQIRKYLGEDFEETPELKKLFGAISDSYSHMEEDRKLLERAMDISSEELFNSNKQLREESTQQKLVLEGLKQSLAALEEDMSNSAEQEKLDGGDLLSITDMLRQQIERRKVAENLLQESQSNLRALIDNTEDSIFSLDKNLRVITFNQRTALTFEKVYGYPPQIGIQLKDLLPEKSYVYWKNIYDKVLAGERMTIEQNLWHKGQKIHFESSFNPIRSRGKVIGLTAFIKNISERKYSEIRKNQLLKNLEAANKELQDFAHITSHDLKSPLRAIGSLVDWLAQDYAHLFDEDGKTTMNLLVQRVRRMYAFIDAMLQYTRLGRLEGQMEYVDMHELVSGVINLSLPNREDIEIRINDKLPIVKCDRVRINQLFQNLMGNAIKFMDKEKGLIEVGCQRPDGDWEFYIRDNGPGIDPKHHDRIFQIFQTLQSRDENESTGIGLSIVKKIVETHGGGIWVESELGKGTTFNFTLANTKDPEVKVPREKVSQ